jgi:hypothetical protein
VVLGNPVPQLASAQTSVAHHVGGVQCATAADGDVLRISCGAAGGIIEAIEFASYGNPTTGVRIGEPCSGWETTACHLPTSTHVVSALCLGKGECVIRPSVRVFKGDPCVGVRKSLAVRGGHPGFFTIFFPLRRS